MSSSVQEPPRSLYVSPHALPSIPHLSQMVDLISSSVMGPNATFRNDSFTDLFNPDDVLPPFFQVFDTSFLDILGPSPSIRRIAFNPDFAFAHEAPIWNPITDEITFASNDGGALGNSGLNANNIVNSINLSDIPPSSNGTEVNVTVTPLDLPDVVQMTNGGTGPYHGDLLLITSGRGPLPPSIVRVNPSAPHNATVLLDNFLGRQFNSLNDIKVHPTSGALFFTDVTYGWLNQFRPLPLMPNQVYRLDPTTRAVRVVADQFLRPNGIAFSVDGTKAFVTDTGANGGFLGNNGTNPATIYQYDVDPTTQAFTNRRTFAYIDAGIPDGIQVDVDGNVYSGCADGVQVWNSSGTLIGKFFVGTTSANMAFAGPGRLVILAETAVYIAEIAAQGPDLANLG
ncbi:hypothetical protein K488DRAFT_75487 [Vararia minispora EC-137]|uniref:Uncharacterized protein n=1 Tax=Vararia minispora EC-137 TaxID=1314806 RepID=A0ACB8QZB6_9AGAM|nr:hypothetical protein K488DRAFT_75487 [Vararia minispora EC-137]